MRTWSWREVDLGSEHCLEIFAGGNFAASIHFDDADQRAEAYEDAQFIVDACNSKEEWDELERERQALRAKEVELNLINADLP